MYNKSLKKGQSGNILLAVYAAIGMVAVLGAMNMNMMKGPVRGVHTVTQNSVVQNDMIASVALLSEFSLSDEHADCDLDDMIEPIAFKTAASGTPAPAGGGLLPDTVGANKTDPWKSTYGYCVWDHGTAVKAAGCGGAAANRLVGGNIATATTIAVISAGPDRIFQTTCNGYVDENTPVVIKPSGSDDVVKEIAYGSFLLPRMAKAKIGEMPDAACTAQTIGTMRIELGVIQVCMDTGWEEIGTSAQADGNFIPVVDSPLGQMHTSNAVSFSGFLNKKTVAVEGNAVLLVNGAVVAVPAQIEAGDYVQLRAAASTIPEQTFSYSVSISGVKKTWSITARNRTPMNLLVSPSPVPGFIVDGESGTAFSATTEFMLTNVGEEIAVVSVPSIINTNHFEIVDNECGLPTHQELNKNESCAVTVRSKATETGVHSGNLNFYATGQYYAGSQAPTAALTSDALFPVVLANTQNVDISQLTAFTANGRWASSRPKRVIVPVGVIIGSSSPSDPAMRTGTGRGGTLTITVNGEIQGAGGQPNSGAGGAAFLAQQAGIIIVNNGAIRAGGGAGGIGGAGGTGYYQSWVDSTGWLCPPNYAWAEWSNGTFTLWWGSFITGHIPSGPTQYQVGSYNYVKGAFQYVTGNGASDHCIKQQYLSAGYSTGGAGGNGGRGQGYGAINLGGNGGLSNPPAGTGGTGGTGGTWGVAGAMGNVGATGNHSGGAGGGVGGAAGYAIQNWGNVSYSGGGARQGNL